VNAAAATWRVGHDLTEAEADTVFGWLSGDTHWAKGQPRSVFDRSLAGSLCFVLRDAAGSLAGFARVISDRATFAYLADVYVATEARGRGAAKALIRAVSDHPDLQGLRRWMLITRDAHGLYEPFGFTPVPHPERFMQRHEPDIYSRAAGTDDRS
jgi:GNAT superfamily N-acetyltransferase